MNVYEHEQCTKYLLAFPRVYVFEFFQILIVRFLLNFFSFLAILNLAISCISFRIQVNTCIPLKHFNISRVFSLWTSWWIISFVWRVININSACFARGRKLRNHQGRWGLSCCPSTIGGKGLFWSGKFAWCALYKLLLAALSLCCYGVSYILASSLQCVAM